MAEGMIYGLIGQAMKKIGAIGKTSRNTQQGFMYRGIDAVYNALNPVMAELGLFICPEVLDQKREERVTKNGTALTYTILTMRYTVYAPDGSNVSVVVVGEGMDSGDKSTNKAMSIAMKYAMFQLFFIPTEELVDPDKDSHTDVMPRGTRVVRNDNVQAVKPAAEITTQSQVPAPEKVKDLSPEMMYLNNELGFIAQKTGKTIREMKAAFMMAVKSAVKDGVVPDKDVKTYTTDELKAVLERMPGVA